MSYRPVPASIDLPALERDILAWWNDHGTFAATLTATADAPRWTFYEGPPTANGTPGTHHVEARTFKDVFPRFKTMQGFHVDRRAGWDCHGLPVELAVEKELGFNGKPDIEAYGIAEFNAKCRDSVQRYVGEWQELTDRVAYWTDMEHPYRTMDSEYVQSVWWALKTIYDQGLLEEDFRVTPYCPRCGTALSDHELAQGYEEDTDPSVYVRFPLTSGPLTGQASLLVWTTTPWTLVSNTAVAAHPDFTYVVATDGNEKLIVAETLVEQALGEGWTIEGSYTGAELAGWTYSRPFTLVEFPDDSNAHLVVTADYVTAGDGTGLVHQAPAFGADDLAVAKEYDLPVVNPVAANGHFHDEVPLVGGVFFKTADKTLIKDLAARDVLFKHEDFVHQYPHCWRCHTHLIYYALPAWYIRTTHIKDQLLAQNENTNWFPETIKHGRFGDWLDNNIDWALSRSRYWGTPLPVWRNDETGALVVVGSLAELGEYAGQDLADLDPHRPFIDEVVFTREGEAGTYRRVPEVIDAWFDSGSMPFAQWGYPHVPGSDEKLADAYPAQYIAEGIDQTRGWFYSLMAVGTLVFGRSSYENVVCLGLLLAEDGRKMSKHLGNTLLPLPLMEEHGADSLRWFMACSGSPWSARRIGHNALSDIVRKVLLTYWNTVAFQALYASTEGWSPATSEAPAVADRPLMDRWLVSQTHRLVRTVTDALEEFDTQKVGQEIAAFVDDLSNWYVRRSRRRFWAGDASALHTLHEAIDVVTRLMAPIVPFITERVWQDLIVPTTPGAAESVHLASWPEADESLIDEDLTPRVKAARRITELGRAARAEAKVRTRQPLRRALIGSAVWELLGSELRDDITAELNIGALESLGGADSDLVDISAKANFRSLGKKYGKETPQVAQAIAAADAEALSAALAEGSASVDVEGQAYAVDADDVILTERPREGWSVVNEQGETVALDLQIDDELRRAGIAREAIRLIQEARKSSGFEVSDRITVVWSADGESAQAIGEHSATIADEVLAVSFGQGDTGDSAFTDDDFGLAFAIAKA